jgi:hypothetical protein
MSKDQDQSSLSRDLERELLTSVLDEIIPRSADGTFPGAGELGVASAIEQTVSERPEIGPLITRGLSQIDTLARSRTPDGFGALSKRDKMSVLREVERTEPLPFGTLFLCTYVGYYADSRVVERLGLRPHPQPDGYDLEPGDLDTLLQKVRQRSEKLYREC